MSMTVHSPIEANLKFKFCLCGSAGPGQSPTGRPNATERTRANSDRKNGVKSNRDLDLKAKKRGGWPAIEGRKKLQG